MMLVIIYVEIFNTGVIVFIGIKRYNVTSHWPLFSILRSEIKGQMSYLPINTSIELEFCMLFVHSGYLFGQGLSLSCEA